MLTVEYDYALDVLQNKNTKKGENIRLYMCKAGREIPQMSGSCNCIEKSAKNWLRVA